MVKHIWGYKTIHLEEQRPAGIAASTLQVADLDRFIRKPEKSHI